MEGKDRELLPTIPTTHEELSVNPEPEPEMSRKAKPAKKGKGKVKVGVKIGKGKGKGKAKPKAVSRGNAPRPPQKFKGKARERDPDSAEAMTSTNSSSSDTQLLSSDSEESESEESGSEETMEHLSAGPSSRGLKSSVLQSRGLIAIPAIAPKSRNSVKSDDNMLASPPILSPGAQLKQIKPQGETPKFKLDISEDLSLDLKGVAEHLANQGKGDVGALLLQTLRELKVRSQPSSPVKLPTDSEATRKREREGSPGLAPSSPTKKSRPELPEQSASSLPRAATVTPNAVPERKVKPTQSPRKKTLKAAKSELAMSVELPRGSRSKTRISEQSQKRRTRANRST